MTESKQKVFTQKTKVSSGFSFTKIQLNMKHIKTQNFKWKIAALLTILAVSAPLLLPRANAGALTNTMVELNSMTQSATTGGTICINTTTATAVKSWVVAFPTGFTANSTTADWTGANINTTSNNVWPAGATAWPNAASATPTVSTPSVTWTNTSAQTMTPGTVYCYNFTFAALTQPSSTGYNEAGTITTQTAGSVTIDTGSFSTATVASDVVNVSATVNPSFSVAFSANSDPLGTLSASSVASNSASTITINSNAKNGWTAWVEDSNTGLKSPSISYTIASNATPAVGANAAVLSAGTEGMNLGISYSQTSGTCSAGSAVPVTFSGAGKGGGFNNSSFQPIVSCVTGTPGTTNNGVITPTNYASINGATPYASDYADNETFVAAGIF